MQLSSKQWHRKKNPGRGWDNAVQMNAVVVCLGKYE